MPDSMNELLLSVSRVRQSRRWAVLLYSGGKFAGGIFDGLNEVVHKTLHHYTVRAKQGGGQSAYDASNGGMGGAKSAGASLRRHGEMAIRAEISQLLHGPASSDNSQLDPALLSCPEPDKFAAAACQAGLGMTADDVRVRRIPCRTNEITYSHVKELHKELSSFYVYGKIVDCCPPHPPPPAPPLSLLLLNRQTKLLPTVFHLFSVVPLIITQFLFIENRPVKSAGKLTMTGPKILNWHQNGTNK
ncbi:unnamed protein product [Echinostoma caproni]|uniref:BVLRF1 domain-containing protein n=1 Tax=Echinostoma caproni TaxID=27848 RepID=A0A183BDF1_9TREM|nr:unnamed protein product [Echinostoma caproni]